jgi:hypothetical protein
MSRTSFVIIFLLSASTAAKAATTISESTSGLTLALSTNGDYFIGIQNSDWSFSGNVPGPLQQLKQNTGTDGIGPYDEINFAFADGGTPKQAGIRVYQQKPAVVFTLSFLAAGENVHAFPTFDRHPEALYRLTNSGWQQHFDASTTDGPLVEFDSGAHTFILSPASNFTLASTSAEPVLASGISPQIQSLPAGFTQRTMLVVDQGINQAFDTWGHALTDLQGKVRPANDADISLSHLGYWTDNGARYYYMYEEKHGYEGTLFAVRDEFQAKGLPLGYMQLDSWFYPKGPEADWQNTAGGIYEYEAAPLLFPSGLKAFQEKLGIPLLTHARWIDPGSPYRHEYQMSNNVSIDPRYWSMIMSYLHDSGASVYEQDWLATHAQTNFNLSDPDAFLDEMARSAAGRGLTIQYCQPLARHYLQTSKYNNVTTIRTSPDRFSERWWDRFLYGSRLASALGIWPWTDVFMSSERDNLLLATLSAGPVGVGDPLGSINTASLLRAVRKDGVIVKPDAPLVPTDQTVLHDAEGLQAPMIAATYTDFGSMKVAYVFAHPRGAATTVSFTPSSVGLNGPVYVYNYFTEVGQVIDASDAFSGQIEGSYAYYIVTPIGPSGVGLLGDLGQFTSLGRQRITNVADDGVVEMTIAFAPDETSRVIQGYSNEPPIVTAQTGTAGAVSFNQATQRFQFPVSQNGAGTAVVQIAPK